MLLSLVTFQFAREQVAISFFVLCECFPSSADMYVFQPVKNTAVADGEQRMVFAVPVLR